MKLLNSIIVLLTLLSLSACDPKLNTNIDTTNRLLSKVDLRSAGVDTVAGAIVSTSTIRIEFTGINISSPTVIIKAFEKSNTPLVKVEKIDITLFRNDSKSSWISIATLVLVFLIFIWSIIHIRRK